MQRFAPNLLFNRFFWPLSLILLALAGCSPSVPQLEEPTGGVGAESVTVGPRSVVVELYTIRSFVNDENEIDVSTVVDEWLLEVGDTFGPRTGIMSEDIFRLDEISGDGKAVVGWEAETDVVGTIIVGTALTDVESGVGSPVRHQLRISSAAEPYLPKPDSKEVIERLATRTSRLTIDSAGAVQEVFYDWGVADQRDFPLLGQLKNLRHLSAPGVELSGSNGRWLSGLKRLAKVDFQGGQLSRGGVMTLAKCRSLTDVVLDDATVSDGELESLTKLASLKSLSMKRTNVSLQSLWSLRRELNDCKVIGGSKFEWGRLSSPDGEKSVVDLAQVADYAHLAQAKLLMAGVHLEVNDLGLVIAADFRRLPDRSTTPAAEAIIGLRKCELLTKLDLSQSNCGSNGLINLAWLANQRRQFIDFNADSVLLKELSLKGVVADPDAWRRLPAQKEIESLDLSNTNIDDASIRSLTLLADLKILNLTDVPVDEDTLDYLSDEKPNLKIVR